MGQPGPLDRLNKGSCKCGPICVSGHHAANIDCSGGAAVDVAEGCFYVLVDILGWSHLIASRGQNIDRNKMAELRN